MAVGVLLAGIFWLAGGRQPLCSGPVPASCPAATAPISCPTQKAAPGRLPAKDLPEDLVDAVDRLLPQKAPEATRPAYPATEEWDEPGAIRPA